MRSIGNYSARTAIQFIGFGFLLTRGRDRLETLVAMMHNLRCFDSLRSPNKKAVRQTGCFFVDCLLTRTGE
ncbi:hypothetical protein [Pseudanabaena mucicola]|uniref:hypothetical protein n=1 Tax=Pseudanabaena mucicola TaxID=71190 RepID=UPI0038D3C513